MSRIIYSFLLLSFIGLLFLATTDAPLISPGPIGKYLDGVLPSSPPGAEGAWEITDPWPELKIPAPIRIEPIKGSEELLVLSKGGMVWKVSFTNKTVQKVLDISSRTFKEGDAGSVGIALHPDFRLSGSENPYIFIYYRTKPNPEEWSSKGLLRLAKFTWDSANGKFLEESEEILIQQFDRSPWHDSGDLVFGEDGFLYFSIGDEGFEEYQSVSTQRLDGGLFSGIFRIDVDNDPNRSHPIRRQPKPNATPPNDYGPTYSQGYSIPDDNPWLSKAGHYLEEYFAIGVRSPFTIHFDHRSDLLWVADVGSDVREEINFLKKGDNLQWPYMEGEIPSEKHTKPTDYIGNERPVYFAYKRDVGTCIIGGGIYHANKYPYLNEKYLFADYTQNKIMALTNNGSAAEPEYEVLINDLSAQPISLPDKPGITGIHIIKNGDILITVKGESYQDLGKILLLQNKESVIDPPAKLSELAVFNNLQTMEVRDGIIPYTVNSPLWSDGASKKRWMAIPNDGNYSHINEKITFRSDDAWSFPSGTVFIKHFELPTDLSDPAMKIPLETRFFVIAEEGRAYGLTYKWNEEGTDATLLGGGFSESYIIEENDQEVFVQSWDYPSRNQCMTCHNHNAGYVLGVNTHQLNGDFDNGNQLDYLNTLGLFDRDIENPASYLKSYDLSDPNASLDLRIRSYLDANCAGCHQYGGLKEITLDLRLTKSVFLKYDSDYPGQSHASNPNHLVISPGDHTTSELWVRDASSDANKMPPLGRNLVDQFYIDSLAKWIDNIENDPTVFHDLLVYPNPTFGFLNIRTNKNWKAPFDIKITSFKGRLIRHQKINVNSFGIDLSDLPKGQYIVVLENSEYRQVRKVVLI